MSHWFWRIQNSLYQLQKMITLVSAQATLEPKKRLTFTRTSAARSVCRQHRGSTEGSLQVIMLLRQLLQGLFQSDALVSFILQGLLPLFTMGLGQHKEISAGLYGEGVDTGHLKSTSQRFPLASVSPLGNLILGTWTSKLEWKTFPIIPQYQGQPALWCNQGQAQEKKRIERGCHSSFIFSWSWGPNKCQVSSKLRQNICGNITKGSYVNYTKRRNPLTKRWGKA